MRIQVIKTYILGKISKISKRYRYYVYHSIRELMLKLTLENIHKLQKPSTWSTYNSPKYIDDWQDAIKQYRIYEVKEYAYA